MAEKTKTKSFEESLKALEKVVEELESGEMPLEAQLKAFEKGVGLSRDCMQRLESMEKKMSQLVEDAEGELSTRPLDGSV